MKNKRGPKPKSPLAKARDFFFDRTKRGEELYEGTASGIYLKNRLIEAFKAGWKACEEYSGAQR